MALWSRRKYSIAVFLRDYVAFHSPVQDTPENQRTAKSAQSNRIRKLADAFEQPCVKDEMPYPNDMLPIWRTVISSFEQELDGLVGKYPFVDWSEEHSQREYQTTQTMQLIQSVAPHWLQLWTTLLRNSRTKPEKQPQPGDNNEDGQDGGNHTHWIILMTATILRTRAKKRANLLTTNYSLYLHSYAIKKKVYEFLQRHGIVISLRALSARLKEIEQASQVCYSVLDVT